MRVGKDPNSAKLPEVLRCGSVLDERELVGDSLRFRKLHGSGPLSGWVTVGLDLSCQLQVQRLVVTTDSEASGQTAVERALNTAAAAGVASRVTATGAGDARAGEPVSLLFRPVRRAELPRRPATLAQWYNEVNDDGPVVDREVLKTGLLKKKWTDDGQNWHNTEESWMVEQRSDQAQVWDLNEMDIVSEVELQPLDGDATRRSLGAQKRKTSRLAGSDFCMRCEGCVRYPGHPGSCENTNGEELRLRPKAPRPGVYVGFAKDVTCPGDDVTFEIILRRGLCILSCAPKLSLFAGGQPPWSCTGTWEISVDGGTITVCVTKQDLRGPKEDQEIELPVAMDGCSATFKGTSCAWTRPVPLPENLNLSGWWKFTPIEDGDVVHFMLNHDPSSKAIGGHNTDFQRIQEGRIDGDFIQWKVDVFTVRGRIDDEGHRLVDLEVTSDLDHRFVVVYHAVRDEDHSLLAQGTCAVCISDFECGDDLRTLVCQHRFHSACVEQWLAIAGHCPVCRTRVNGSR